MNAATTIEHIALTQADKTHALRFGTNSLVQKFGTGQWVVGRDAVARFIPTTFKTKRDASEAAADLVFGAH